MKKVKIICFILCIALFIPTVSALNNINNVEDDYSQYSILQGSITNLEFEQISGKQFQVSASIQCNDSTLITNFICDLYKFGTIDMLTYNKTIGDIVYSDQEILNFSICPQNDVLNPDYIIGDNQALVKLAYIVDSQTVISATAIFDSELLPVMDSSFDEIVETEDNVDELQRKLKKSETWISRFSEENINCEEQQLSEPNNIAENLFQAEAENTNESTIIEYYSYEPNDALQPLSDKNFNFDSDANSVIKAASSITGDDHMIVNNIFPESILKSSGCRTGTKTDTNGRIFAGYHTDTYFDSMLNRYYTAGAIWNFNYSVSSISGQASQRMAEFEFRKSYNFFIYYYVSENRIVVTYAPDDSTHVITDKTMPSIKLAGKKNSAYIDKYYFEMCEGGTSGGTTPILISNAVSLVGKRFPLVATVSEIYGYLSDTADLISNYNFNKALKEYQIYQLTNQFAKQIGSTYAPILGKKNSALKIRAKLLNLTFSSDKKPKIFFQVQTYVRDCIRTGNDELIYFYFGQNLK